MERKEKSLRFTLLLCCKIYKKGAGLWGWGLTQKWRDCQYVTIRDEMRVLQNVIILKNFVTNFCRKQIEG